LLVNLLNTVLSLITPVFDVRGGALVYVDRRRGR
jgi:hypothetical protein